MIRLGLLGLLVVFGIVGWAFYRALSIENLRVRSGTHAHGTFNEFLLNEVLHAKEFDRPADPVQRDKSDGDFSRLATTYYHRDGPLGRVMEKYNWFAGPPNTYGADARLPASTMGLLARPCGPMPVEALAQLWTEPPVAVLFMQAHAIASYARPQKFYRVIVVESSRGQKYLYRFFKNHVSPAAMMIFDQALAEDGLLCFHTSNRYHDISRDVAVVAQDFGWSAIEALDFGNRDDDVRLKSNWVIVGRRMEHLQFLNLPPPPAGKDGIRWQFR